MISPLPNIDMIIDSIYGHDNLYFMDGFFGYYQILINLADQHKSSFTTPWGYFFLEGYAFWIKKYECYLPKGYGCNVS